jgi:hypothetical protein
MELAINRAKDISLSAIREVVIALAIGVSYFVLCVINPAQSLVALTSITTFGLVRVADILRAGALYSPGVAAGVAFGAHYYNVYTGKVTHGGYPVMPIIIFGIWLFVQSLSKKWGQSALKDLTLIGFAGLMTGIVVTANLTTVAALTSGTAWSKLLKAAALWKIATHVFVPMLGYPLFKKLRG